MSKLTVTIPSYKQVIELRRSLDSLVDQTFKDFDVLIIDDCSGVDFNLIIKDYINRLDLKVIKNESNLGAMNNMLKSITLNTGNNYIFSLHEDDYIKNNYIEEAVKLLDSNDNISFVLTTPIWIPRNSLYINESIKNPASEIFDAPTFVFNILNNRKYIFSSVIYRVEHIIKNWDFEVYNVFCDRYFLTKILESNNSIGAEIIGSGIFVTDHTLDAKDSRSIGVSEENGIALLSMYKEVLLKKYDKKIVNKLTTNGLLLFYNNFEKRSSLYKFYLKQKEYGLLHIIDIRPVGLYSLLTLTFKPSYKKKIVKLFKPFVKTNTI